MNEKKSPYKLKTLLKYKEAFEKGDDIPFGVESSLIAQGMIPRKGGEDEGKKVVSPEYKNESVKYIKTYEQFINDKCNF